MGRTAAATVARERALLLVRLAAIALGGTLVLLAGVGATSLAALVLVLYLAAAVSVRYYPPLQRIPFVVPVLDLAAVTGLVFALPLSLGPWILYAFAIGVAALRSGPVGAVAATALAVVGYDATLVVRGEQARATDLWPVQALIAIGLVIAEIVWALGRQDVDTLWSRIHARALSGLTRQREPDEVLRALVHELARLQSVHGAWVWALGPDQRLRTTVTTGAAPPAEIVVSAESMRALQAPSPLERIVPDLTGLSIPISVDPPLTVGVALGAIKEEDRATTAGAIHDLVGDAASLLSAAFERTQREAELRTLDDAARAIAEIDGERTQAGVLASTVLGAGRIASGRAAIVRPSDGTVVVGDLPGGPIAELARDRRLPAIVSASAVPLAARTLVDTTIALVTLSEGRVLAALGPPEVLSVRLESLESVARAARDRLAILAERDALQLAATELGRDVQSLGGALRAKEDALTTAVHELRNPLTAVHGYATLMSRNLQAVQGQLTQLERLMADLLSAEQQTPGDEAPVDAATEARQAIARARIRGARIDLDAPAEPVRVAIGEARFAQLLDNLISNAIKYSPTGEPILVSIAVEESVGKVSVIDHGTGIAAEHLARIFDRFYRVGGTADAVAGQGLGLSICKEIVTAHGGKIWAESDGAGRGSTFAFTLPLAVAAPTT
ncbi:MAG TPA: ATP-binding protein [Candidatus Bathyarchaeia archaeon]|nr:ATP-binding protein [Candidatus Bathyarchaeia archaeon]